MLKLFLNKEISLCDLNEMLERAKNEQRFGDCILLRDIIAKELYFETTIPNFTKNCNKVVEDVNFNFIVLEETINELIEAAVKFIESVNNQEFGDYDIKNMMSENMQLLYKDIKELKLTYYKNIIRLIKGNKIKYTDKEINKRYKNKKILIIKSLTNEMKNINNEILASV